MHAPDLVARLECEGCDHSMRQDLDGGELDDQEVGL
jgi:hypothetical protein